MTNWFEFFLNEAADLYFTEAERCDHESEEALRLGDLMVAVRWQGEATAYRRMGRAYRRQRDLAVEVAA